MSCLACGAPLGRRRKDVLRETAALTSVSSAATTESPASPPQRVRIAWVGLLALVTIGLIWWWYSAFTAHLPLEPEGAPIAAQAPIADVADVPLTVPVSVAEGPAVVPASTVEPASAELDATPAVKQLNQAVEAVRARDQRKEAERLAAQERARAARIAERQRLQEARELAAKEAAAVAVPPAPPAATPAPAPVVVATPPVKTVAQACAGETNIFARDFCRIDACRLPANVNDAVCVSYRQMEAERRARMAN
jgi:hypothetical protein